MSLDVAIRGKKILIVFFLVVVVIGVVFLEFFFVTTSGRNIFPLEKKVVNASEEFKPLEVLEVDRETEYESSNEIHMPTQFPWREFRDSDFFTVDFPIQDPTCSFIPKPLNFSTEGLEGIPKALVSHRNLMEQLNFDQMTTMCKKKCAQKSWPEAPPDVEEFLFYTVGGIAANMFDDYWLKQCPDVKMKRTTDKEKAHFLLFNRKKSVKKYQKINPDKFVAYVSREVIVTDEKAGYKPSEQNDHYVHFTPFSDQLHFYIGIDSMHESMKIWSKYNVDFGNTWDFSTYRDDLIETIRKKEKEWLGASFISSCDLKMRWHRTQYFGELEKRINIKSFGKCGKHTFNEDFEKKGFKGFKSLLNTGSDEINYGNNSLIHYQWYDLDRIWYDRELPLEKKFMRDISSKRKASKVMEYNKVKFSICFDNRMRYNYHSEKLSDCLLSPYSVPVYMGAPNAFAFYDRYLITKYKWFIFANDFPNPHDLADYLLYLDRNDTAYLEYFQGRLDGYELRNSRYLMENMFHRQWGVNGEYIHPPCKVGRIVKYGLQYCVEG